MPQNIKRTAILLIVCQDQAGLVAAVSQFLYQHRGNIVTSDQHTDYETSTFLMRIEWELQDFDLDAEGFRGSFQPIAEKYAMRYELHVSDLGCRMAILVSKYSHCFYDLLVRHASGELKAEIPLILSNHPDLEEAAAHFRIPFHLIRTPAGHSQEVERQQLQLLEDYGVDLVVLARYMQILSPKFVERFPNRIINIHHSFLPAFIGAKPYHQAYARGVKLIGATSHYVTEELDNGPIIHQSVTPITHSDRVEDLIRKGQDQEKAALAFAVRMHTQRRILTYGNKTVVFG